MRSVTAAIAEIVVHASGNGVVPSKAGFPSGEYGYFDARLPGKKRWSLTMMPWKPASSAARAMPRSCSGSANETTCQNFTVSSYAG